MSYDAGFRKHVAPINVHPQYEIKSKIFFLIHHVNGAFSMNIYIKKTR